MYSGEKLGEAIKTALKKKGAKQADLARFFGVKPQSVSGWLKHGRVAKEHLDKLISYFSDVVPPSHFGIESLTAMNQFQCNDNGNQTLNVSNVGVQISGHNYGDVCGHTNPGNGTINIHQENNNFSEKTTTNSNVKLLNPKKLTVMEALQLATPFAMKRVSEEFFEQEELPQGYSIEQAQVDTLFEYAKLILLTYPHYKYELERLSVYDDPKRIYPTD